MKRTLVVGASPNPSRYSFIAAELLAAYEHEVELVGIKKGVVIGQEIDDIRNEPHFEDIDTITLYVGPKNQPSYYDYLLGLNPKRIIFNPGTENDEFIEQVRSQGIEADIACTLVLLRTNQY